MIQIFRQPAKLDCRLEPRSIGKISPRYDREEPAPQPEKASRVQRQRQQAIVDRYLGVSAEEAIETLGPAGPQ